MRVDCLLTDETSSIPIKCKLQTRRSLSKVYFEGSLVDPTDRVAVGNIALPVTATDRAATLPRLFAGRPGVGERGLFPDRGEASTEDWHSCPTASDKRLGRRGGGEGEEGGGGGAVLSVASRRYLS